MDAKDKKYTIEGVLIAILWVAAFFAVALFFSRCMTPEKAVGYLKKKELLADTCAANFPVKERTDTLIEIRYREDSTLINELLAINKGLEAKLAYLEGLPPKIDSATCQQLRLMYIRDVRLLQLKIKEMQAAAAKQKDSLIKVITTKVDSAALKALQEKHDALQQDKKVNDAKNEARIKELEGKVSRRGKNMWISMVANVLLLLIIGFLISKAVKIPFITSKK